jgi:hypothetical protein
MFNLAKGDIEVSEFSLEISMISMRGLVDFCSYYLSVKVV